MPKQSLSNTHIFPTTAFLYLETLDRTLALCLGLFYTKKLQTKTQEFEKHDTKYRAKRTLIYII